MQPLRSGAQCKEHTEADWTNWRPFIGELYGKGVKQKGVMRALAQRGFPVTPAQLKRKINQWGIQKNVTRSEYLSVRQHSRDGPQKGGVFIVRRKVVDERKFARAMERFAKDLPPLHDESASTNGSVSDSTVTASSVTRIQPTTPQGHPDSRITSSTSRSEDVVPTSMLQAEYFMAALSLDEARVSQIAVPDLEQNELQDDNAEQNDHLRRWHSIKLLNNAFHNHFLQSDRFTQLSVCLRMWTQAINLYTDSCAKEAGILQTVVVEWLPHLVPKTSPWLVSSIGLLSTSCGEQAKYIEAEENHREQLIRARAIHGEEHPVTLVAQHHLALLFMHTGRLKSAAEHAQKAHDVQCRTIGSKHRDSLFTSMTLGGIALRSREYAKAQNILKQVAIEFEKQLGETALFTLRNEQELARCLFESGQLQAAKELYTISISKQNQTLGPEHPETLAGLVRLARVLIALGENVEAEKILLPAISVFDLRHSPADPITLRARLELAAAYERPGKMEAALLTQQRVIEANEGRAHKCPWILKGMARSAWRYWNAGLSIQAVETQRLVVRMSELQDEAEEEVSRHKGDLEGMLEGNVACLPVMLPSPST